MFIEFTGVDYELKQEKLDEINQAQVELFESEDDEDGLTPEQAESLGIALPSDNNRKQTKFLLKHEDYNRVEYNYYVKKHLVEEFYSGQDNDTILKLETGELITVKESTKEVAEKLRSNIFIRIFTKIFK